MAELERESGNVKMDRRLRTCAACGMLCDQAGEFHPYMFCVLKRAGRDPWKDFAAAVELLGLEPLPDRPPLVRDLLLAREARGRGD